MSTSICAFSTDLLTRTAPKFWRLPMDVLRAFAVVLIALVFWALCLAALGGFAYVVIGLVG